MKKLNFRIGLGLVLLAGLLPSLTASAQMPDVGGFDSAMIKLFGDNPSFTAQADVRVMNSNRVVWLQMPSVFAVGDAKLRVDVDIKRIKSSSLNSATINMLTQAGMDRITSVIRPDKRATFLIYPGKKSFVAMPLAVEDAQFAAQRVEKRALGRETVDGHACVKNLSTVKSSKGVPLLQATTWNAADLKDFPIQIEMREGGNATVMHFQNVNLTKPDPRLFDIPAGYKDETVPVITKPAGKKKK